MNVMSIVYIAELVQIGSVLFLLSSVIYGDMYYVRNILYKKYHG